MRWDLPFYWHHSCWNLSKEEVFWNTSWSFANLFFVMYVWIMEFQLMTLTGPCWFSSIIWYCISSKRKWCSAGRTSWIISPTRRKWIRRTGWWSSVKTILTCNDYLLLVLIEYFCKIQVLIVICKQCFFQLI